MVLNSPFEFLIEFKRIPDMSSKVVQAKFAIICNLQCLMSKYLLNRSFNGVKVHC